LIKDYFVRLQTQLKKFFQSLSSPRYRVNFLRTIIFFLRREGDYLIVYGKKFDISDYIPYAPIFLLVLFVSVGYILQGNSITRINGQNFVVWNEAAVASTIDSMDQYTPLIQGKKTQFYQVVEQQLNQPAPALTTDSTLYLGAESMPLTNKANAATAARKSTIDYTVQNGDTVSGIANKFGLKIETLQWANNLSDVDTISPGQTLKIPPVDGVLYTIDDGDTLLAVVNYYSGDYQKTLDVNGISDASKIYVGQKIIVVGGNLNATSDQTQTQTQATDDSGQAAASQTSGTTLIQSQGNFPNSFPYGWCTWYVASRRYIPWTGNAGQWLYNAQSAGYATGSQPRVGAVMVSNESWFGHVALVEAVYGSSFLVSEMNGVAGWGQVDYRVISANDGSVSGFIY
jgi:surface antigen